MKQNRIPGFLTVVLVLILSGGCPAKNGAPDADETLPPVDVEILPPVGMGASRPAVPTAMVATYELQIGDVFDVKIYNHPELDENLVIRPDGRVSMLLAEDIVAAGLTPEELDRVITECYRKKIKDPEVAVILRKFTGNRVYVGGEVHSPRQLSLEGPMTALQAIYQAGGFKETAKKNCVLVLRDIGKEKPSAFTIDLRSVQAGRQGDVYLMPYDAVFVSKTFIAKADKFVDQYINQIVPRNLTASMVWTYNLTPFMEVFNR